MQKKMAVSLIVIGTALLSGLVMAADQPQQSKKAMKVQKGETFEISIQQALTPWSEWICTGYDKGHLKYLGKESRAPTEDPQIMGATYKVFKFKAIKAGKAEVELSYCRVDEESKPVEVLKIRTYQITIGD
jgi:predicted secreted protein